MFVPKPFKIETKLNSNQSQIYPGIQLTKCIGTMEGSQKLAERNVLPCCASTNPVGFCFIALTPGLTGSPRRPQKAPGEPQKASGGPRKPHEPFGEPRKHQKGPTRPQEPPGGPRNATGGSRKGSEGARRPEEAPKPSKLKGFWARARGSPKLMNRNVLDQGCPKPNKLQGFGPPFGQKPRNVRVKIEWVISGAPIHLLQPFRHQRLKENPVPER